jgi:replicative DNA helicase
LRDEFRESLVNLKKTAESYVVLSIYKKPELYFDSNLTVHDFHSEDWKFYFAIAQKLIHEDKKVFDDIVVGLKVAENEHLQKMYEEYGGWATIQNGVTFVQEENYDGYLKDMKKYSALIKLHDLGFPIMEKFAEFKVMSVEHIQQVLEGVLASVFANVDIDEQVEDLSDGLWDTVMEAHEGKMRGFPYSSALLNEYVNGMPLGNITLLSANSGVGKTFFALAQILPNMIEFKEKLLILANEEDSKKWKKEIITWVINNVLGGNFEKSRFNQGEFTQEELDILKKGVEWLQEKMEKGIIRFVNFTSFSMNKAIKIIKKYSTVYNVKYFILDTLKLDSDAINENAQAWLQLQQNMVKLYDLIKPSNKNLHVFATYQLGKSAMLSRYLSQNSLGVSKNVTDVVSVLLLTRKALESEKEGGKNEIIVKRHKDGKQIKLDRNKEYFIVFLGKNRMGSTYKQLVFEIDQGKNIMKDVGTCIIEQDI